MILCKIHVEMSWQYLTWVKSSDHWVLILCLRCLLYIFYPKPHERKTRSVVGYILKLSILNLFFVWIECDQALFGHSFWRQPFEAHAALNFFWKEISTGNLIYTMKSSDPFWKNIIQNDFCWATSNNEITWHCRMSQKLQLFMKINLI